MRLDLIGPRRWAGAQEGRAGALLPWQSGSRLFRCLLVSSRVFVHVRGSFLSM
jgi:hypothetical protein